MLGSLSSTQPNGHNVTPLHVACASDWKVHGQSCMTVQVKVAEALWEQGADLNGYARYRGIDDATPLSAHVGHRETHALVRWLLDHGALATDGDLRAALGHFQRHGKAAYDIAEVLLAWGLPVDGSVSGDRTLLQAFAHHAAHKTVAWLIEHGADVQRTWSRRPNGGTFLGREEHGPNDACTTR